MNPGGYNFPSYRVPGYGGHIPRNHGRRDGSGPPSQQVFGLPSSPLPTGQGGQYMPMLDAREMQGNASNYYSGDCRYVVHDVSPTSATGLVPNSMQQPQAHYPNAIPPSDGGSVSVPAGFEVYQQPWPQQPLGQNQPDFPGNATTLKDCQPATIAQSSSCLLPAQNQTTANLEAHEEPAEAHVQIQRQDDLCPVASEPQSNQAQEDPQLSAVAVQFAGLVQQQQLPRTSKSSSNAQPPAPLHNHARGDFNLQSAQMTKSKARMTTSRTNNSARISSAIYKTEAPLPSSYAGHIPGFKHNSNGRTFGQAFSSSKQFIDECLYKNKKR